MDSMREDGRRAAAEALHRLADGVEAGSIAFGGSELACSDDFTLVIELRPRDAGQVRSALVHLMGWDEDSLALERELSHPGG